MLVCLKSHDWRASVVFLLIILFSFYTPRIVSANTQDEAYMLIHQTDKAVSLAFKAVLEAENSGANISGLILRLNEAGSFLVEAKILVNNGNSDGAVELASRSVEIANGVEDEASNLKASTLSGRELAFNFSLIGLVAGVPAFLVFLFLLWRLFRVFYIRKVLRKKPEVVSDIEI